ncbi:hypothetical protein ACMAY7_08390 [Rhodobacteraceae bacterium nBUS_24]
MKQSISETDRILSLDVVRGFALLGILLVNILVFGAISAMTSNPPLGLSLASYIYLVVLLIWAFQLWLSPWWLER